MLTSIITATAGGCKGKVAEGKKIGGLQKKAAAFLGKIPDGGGFSDSWGGTLRWRRPGNPPGAPDFRRRENREERWLPAAGGTPGMERGTRGGLRGGDAAPYGAHGGGSARVLSRGIKRTEVRKSPEKSGSRRIRLSSWTAVLAR